MNENLILSALGLTVLLLAGAVVWYLLERSRARESTRTTIDALDRARNGLSQEMRSGDAALQAAIDRSASHLGTHIGQQVTEVRRDQADALGDQRRLLIQGGQSQSEELMATRSELRDRLDGLRDSQAGALKLLNEEVRQSLAEGRQEQQAALDSNTNTMVTALEGHGRNLTDTATKLQRELSGVREAQTRAALELGKQVADQLEILRKDSEAKLEAIRATVDEKLQTTLENRLGESFRLISERLEQLHRGFGEMQALAGDVGDLTRVLSNVKNRGTFGEIQLEALLADFLTQEQYSRNVATVPGSSERVEFAVHLPAGEEGGEVRLLPIDSKFPLEDYQRLQLALEAADAKAAQEARKALRARVLQEATSIRDKYLAPPLTADYGLLFLPSESLYAEVLSIPGIQDDLRRHHIIAVGPTTVQALLASFQLGLRNLAIQKRSTEVWRVLGAVKAEFGRFGEALNAVGKKLQEAQNKLDAVSKRSRSLKRSLDSAHELPEAEAAHLLGSGDGTPDPDEEPVVALQ